MIEFPIKLLPPGNYGLVIEDANGVVYFWLEDGTYDGFDAPADSSGSEVSNMQDNLAN